MILLRARLLRFALITGAFLLCTRSFAYSNFIGYGYASCVTCHYNASGNGPLRDYGRALYANEIAGRLFVPKKISDEVLAEYSGFAGKPNSLPQWLRPSAEVRAFHYESSIGTPSAKAQSFWMESDASLVLRFGSKNQFYVVGTAGFLPKPSTAGPDNGYDYEAVARHYYLGYDFFKNWQVLIGKTDKIFGLRVPDHTAFSRQNTGLSFNDQAAGVQLHYAPKSFDIGIGYFLGDPVQDPTLRQVGASGLFEYEPFRLMRVGGSYLSSRSSVLKEEIKSLHVRYGYPVGMSVISEFGWLTQSSLADSTQDPKKSFYIFLQPQLRIVRGLHFLGTFECLNDHLGTASTAGQKLRIIPGLQYFPIQRLELRVEARNDRTAGAEPSAPSTWDFYGQAHLSL